MGGALAGQWLILAALRSDQSPLATLAMQAISNMSALPGPSFGTKVAVAKRNRRTCWMVLQTAGVMYAVEGSGPFNEKPESGLLQTVNS